jgi:hypothetical protein
MLMLPSGPAAHEIPVDVTVQTFVRPEGDRARVLVRVPLRAMRDVDFPVTGPGYLDLERADAALRTAATQWIAHSIELHEDEVRLGGQRLMSVRASLPSDRSFRSFEDALAHVMGTPLPADTTLMWDQALLDVLLEYPIRSDASRFSVRLAFERLGLRVITVLRFVAPDGAVRAFEYSGDPGVVRLDPRWHQAALRFVALGFFHILDGIDHLLFLLCLVIPFRRLRPLVLVVTAFTVAHSATLVGSAYGIAPDALWFPPLVETLIATSIVYMALENIVWTGSVERRWAITFAFGLVHGFGFSFALQETLQFAGSHLLTSLLAFNVGVELGQLLVLIVLVPVLQALFRFVISERIGAIILSALIAHTGWHWMVERGSALGQYQWPALDAALLATAMRWMLVLVVIGGMAWLAGVVRQPARRQEPRPSASPGARGFSPASGSSSSTLPPP